MALLVPCREIASLGGWGPGLQGFKDGKWFSHSRGQVYPAGKEGKLGSICHESWKQGGRSWQLAVKNQGLGSQNKP